MIMIDKANGMMERWKAGSLWAKDWNQSGISSNAVSAFFL
jgi:hypothetical protein